MPDAANPVKAAAVTGGHAFDVVGFHELMRGLEGVDVYIQHMDDFCSSRQAVRDGYDVVLFYAMLMDGPSDTGLPGYAGKPETALGHLGEVEQGIVLLHHAILAYPQWPVWNEIVGIIDRRLDVYHHDQSLRIAVASAEHPVTQGVTDWAMVDETYAMQDAGQGSKILLTVDHPDSMKTVAWTRHYGKARVFCYQLGHDNLGWSHPQFREVLTRGIRWAARRL
jgi:hypothetical protein